MSNEKLITLLRTLLQRTTSGAASWTSGSRDDTYIWSGSSASVAVLTRDNDGASPFIVRLIDGGGRIIEDEVYEHGDAGYDMISDLYGAARADALDINAAIDGLLDDLG